MTATYNLPTVTLQKVRRKVRPRDEPETMYRVFVNGEDTYQHALGDSRGWAIFVDVTELPDYDPEGGDSPYLSGYYHKSRGHAIAAIVESHLNHNWV